MRTRPDPTFRRWLRRTTAASLAALPCLAAWPQDALPVSIRSALQRARLPETALVALVQSVDADAPALAWRTQQPVNPASVFKLVTTYAALDLLGPAWSWSTPVYWRGSPKDGVLDGPLWIRGTGDPSLTQERVWLLLRQLQQRGVREIRGDILLDRSAWQLPSGSPGDFDGDASRPYNVLPDPLLLNLKSFTLTLTPEPAQGWARISSDTALAGVSLPATVALSTGPCQDWRAGLRPDFSQPLRLALAGSYPLRCGERSWPLAFADPASFNARLIARLWQELGGQLQGQVIDGRVPPDLAPALEVRSPPLAEVVRQINKFSNNVMAEQLFWSLPAATRPPGTTGTDGTSVESSPTRIDDARATLRRWLEQQLGAEITQEAVIANGSGLSRDNRLTAQQLAKLLWLGWRSPVMPEWLSSLPVSGVDGTLTRSGVAVGRAHLKTGSLRDVQAMAGVVLAPDGTRWVVVAILNHAQAGEGRPVLEAVLQWVLDQKGKVPSKDTALAPI